MSDISVGSVVEVKFGDPVTIRKLPRNLKSTSSIAMNLTVGEKLEVTDSAAREQYDYNTQRTEDDIIKIFKANFGVDFKEDVEWKKIIGWHFPLQMIKDFIGQIKPHCPEAWYDTAEFAGEYVVIKEYEESYAVTDWGRTYGHETVHNVFAKKLKNGEYDPDGVEIAVSDSFVPIRQMTMSFA